MNTKIFVKHLNELVEEYHSLQSQSKHNDLSDLPKSNRQALVMRTIAAVTRITGEQSTYAKEIIRIQNEWPELHMHTSSIIGVAKALLEDLKSGYIKSLIEIIHGDMFADFLEMAKHLNDSGYKDAAAVIAGSSLEGHLRNLCIKNGLPTEITKADGSTFPKKADNINSDLGAATIYSKLDQKNVTAWLDLRNKAAHGKYQEYTPDQVVIMVSSIRDFITRNPA